MVLSNTIIIYSVKKLAQSDDLFQSKDQKPIYFIFAIYEKFFPIIIFFAITLEGKV